MGKSELSFTKVGNTLRHPSSNKSEIPRELASGIEEYDVG